MGDELKKTNIEIDKINNINISDYINNYNESDELFENIRETLSSSIRIKLLLSLFSSKKDSKEIQEDTGLANTTILTGLNTLKNIGLVKKVEKDFTLSSNGLMITSSMLKFFENLYSISNSYDFLENHSVEDIPTKQLSNLLMIKNAQCIKSSKEDLTKPSKEYLDLISKSKNLKILMPIFSPIYLDGILDSLANGSTLELIITEPILESMEINGYYNKLLAISDEMGLNKNQFIKIWKVPEDFKLFLSSGNNFLAVNLFFKDSYYDDSEILIDKTKDGIKWGNQIFEDYRKKGELIDIESIFYSN